MGCRIPDYVQEHQRRDQSGARCAAERRPRCPAGRAMPRAPAGDAGLFRRRHGRNGLLRRARLSVLPKMRCDGRSARCSHTSFDCRRQPPGEQEWIVKVIPPDRSALLHGEATLLKADEEVRSLCQGTRIAAIYLGSSPSYSSIKPRICAEDVEPLNVWPA